MTYKNILIFFLLIGSSISYSQKEDNNWIIGKFGLDKVLSGLNQFDFNLDNVQSIQDKKVFFNFTNSILSDKEGNIVVFSNGMKLFDKNFNIIKGGDTINYNEYWEIFNDDDGEGNSFQYGLRFSQGMLLLPWPNKDSVLWITPNYKIINQNISGDYKKGFFMGIVDVSREEAKVVLNNSLFTTDTISSDGITACRHANGRDWWVIIGNHNMSKLYTYLFDPNGLHFVHSQSTSLDYIFGLGQAVFSPNGDKYAIYQVIGAFGYLDQGHFSIFDFDRSTGLLSQHRYKKFVGEEFLVGCAISADSKYLYTSNKTKLYQYDLESNDILNSEKLIAISDGFKTVINPFVSQENFFTFMQLAPDGKIYSPGGNTMHMHRIEYPEEEGENCKMNQHVINTFLNSSSIPNMPYFRLGPLDGSPADTLGLDNHPIAKFRYEADTTNHLNVRFTDLSYFRPETWSWDFGDGTSFDGKKPYWHTFPKNGTYNICLTVSNENSSNTSCRMITIGTNGIEHSAKSIEVVNVFPNPTEGPLLVTLSEYIPEKANIILFDLTGREVYKQRVFYDWNNVDISKLSSGTYVYKVMDGKRKIGEGKVVKI